MPLDHQPDTIVLDLDEVRRHFPAFGQPENKGESFFENAGGSFACRQTIEALTDYYVANKVQPYAEYQASARAGALMDRSRQRWAEALGVEAREVVFGPSTSANTYVLGHAFAELLGAGDEIVVTDQDHEANTGAIRRAAQRAGATIREWRVDPVSGLLDLDELRGLMTDRTRLVTMPHASNIIGQENDVATATAIVHAAGARIVIDGVSFAPHSIPDVRPPRMASTARSARNGLAMVSCPEIRGRRVCTSRVTRRRIRMAVTRLRMGLLQ